MPSTFSRIRFPVIRAVEIVGYQLYPGIGGQGLVHSFDPGVSVIVGVNGLGKTTLLNALLRTLIGPWDPPREDPEEVGSTKHELIFWRSPNYFSDRVPDKAERATISLVVTFGTRSLRITRRLSNLEILKIFVDGKETKPSKELHFQGDNEIPPYERLYRDVIGDLSGVSDYYDFRFLVRNLIFYLEDRRPLLWTEQGQLEIARILFADPKDSDRLAKLTDAIKSIDSRYRSLRTEIGTKERQIKGIKKSLELKDAEGLTIEAASAALSGSEHSLQQIRTKMADLVHLEQDLAEEIRLRQINCDALARVYEEAQQAYFAGAFPKAEANFHHILAHLVSDSGCLTCGSDGSHRAVTLREEISKGICPICGAPPEEQEVTDHASVSAPSIEAAEEVNKARERALEATNLVRSLRTRRQSVADELASLARQRESARLERDRAREMYSRVTGLPTADQPELARLIAAMNVDRERLRQLDDDRRDATLEFRNTFSGTKSKILSGFEETKKHFGSYVTAFIAEPCTLDVQTKFEALGQGGPTVEQPRIRVSMRSPVHGGLTIRSSREQLSESQREFVDLAFRMALIRAAAADEGAMLVLETPEASLDSLFVYSAGDVLQGFGAEGSSIGNVVLASSNLNESAMIPALLGIDRKPPVDPHWRQKHVVNLLDIAVQTGALSKRERVYRDRFARATTPDPDRAVPALTDA